MWGLAQKILRRSTFSVSRCFVKLALLFMLAAWSANAQTNLATITNQPGNASNFTAEARQAQINRDMADAQVVEQMRDACIQGRRSICGKILKVLPEGLVVESGYTNLYREPLTRTWLVPGTVEAGLATNIIESSEPASVCIGVIFLTDYPKSRRAKPKQYDYVIIAGYPEGQYTYTSVGNLQKTVRRFSASLPAAVKMNLQTAKNSPAETGKVESK
jgi:hypothetical protein